MWKDSIRNIVVIFQTKILRNVGFYVRRSANDFVFVSYFLLITTCPNVLIARLLCNDFGQQLCQKYVRCRSRKATAKLFLKKSS